MCCGRFLKLFSVQMEEMMPYINSSNSSEKHLTMFVGLGCCNYALKAYLFITQHFYSSED